MKFIKADHGAEYVTKSHHSWADFHHGYNQATYTLPDTDTKLWYENRDGYHTVPYWFDHIIEQAENGRTGWGINLNEKFLNGIVIANSSTAWWASEEYGSNTRVPDMYGTWWYSIRDMWEGGTLQFFPEHSDYDDLDWFKLNQPYVVTTQGSSGSELNELQRCRTLVLSLRPEVREWLIQNRRVGDVLSYLMRSNLYSGYLDPLCHRVVVDVPIDFRDVRQVDVDLAASITLETIPPRLKLRVISDSLAVGDRNELSQTSIIRTDEVAAFRRTTAAEVRTIVVELECDKPSTYHWVKCQGECAIVFENPEKSRATITIPLGGEFLVNRADGSEVVSNRVEVIAVAHDGTHYSSPVFVSEYFPPETRGARKRVNEFFVHADNAFVAKVNGVEVLSGTNWNARYRKGMQWERVNRLEVEVQNLGGPGGLLVAAWVGEVGQTTDATWETAVEGGPWVTPTVIPHGNSPWRGIVLPKDIAETATWIWHPDLGEGGDTVYFRKTIMTGAKPKRRRTKKKRRK